MTKMDLPLWSAIGGGLAEATVVSLTQGTYVVRLDAPDGSGAELDASCAHAGAPARPGDRAIVAALRPGVFAVLGVMRPPQPAIPMVLEAPGGASARIAGEAIEVRDPEGRLVFRLDPTGAATLQAPDGDLTLAAPHGRVAIAGARGVRIETPAALDLAGERVAITGAEQGGSVRLAAPSVGLAAHGLAVTAARASLALADTTMRGATLTARLARVSLTLGALRQAVGVVVERAREVHRTVEKLWHLKAGRVRVVADGALHQTGEQATLLARRDMRIDGDKIHLG